MLNIHLYLRKNETQFNIYPNYSRICVLIYLLDIKTVKNDSIQLGKLYFLRVDQNRFCLFQCICNINS